MSYYYRRHHCREGRISFPFHEYVSALLVYMARNRLLMADERLGNLLKIVAKAIARHHTAMVERDLMSVQEDKRAKEIIKDAIKELDPSLLKELVAQGLVGEFPQDLADLIADAHRDLVEANISQQLRNLIGTSDRWLVAGLAGFLIVADNIVASKIRGSTDGHTPLYIKMWVEELGGRVEECSLRCSRVPGHG
jgi:CRISPR/Cas system-associated endonuclease Cas3-HD